MLKHNLLIIYRNFLRSKSFFLINLFGFTAGLTCTLLIYLWVNDELNMDKFNSKDERLYQVLEHQRYSDNVFTVISTPGLLAETMKQELPEIEMATTVTWPDKYLLSLDDKVFTGSVLHVAPDFFNMFDFPFVEGSPQKALEKKTNLVISDKLAEQIFGKGQSALGKQIMVNRETLMEVTGVFQKPKNSSFTIDLAISYEVYKEKNDWLKNWGSNSPPSYVLLKEGVDAEALSKKIEDFIKPRVEETHVKLFLKKFSDLYLYGRYTNGKPDGGRIEYVQLFSIVAVVILVIACVNFMNLSTAQATRKTKEVGVKKAVGASRKSLVIQYYTEAAVIALSSLVLAVMIVWSVLPAFNVLTGKEIVLDLFNPIVIFGMLGIVAVATLLAGSYPAIYLSGFHPATVLKGGRFSPGGGATLARKGLVVFQFFISIILISAVIVLFKQIQFTQNKPLGYNKENLVRMPMVKNIREKLETYLTELNKVPGVLGATSAGHNFTGRNNNTSGLEWDGKLPDEKILFEHMRANYDMMELLEFELAEGRFFSRKFAPDTASIIFNETGIRAMNLQNPIGKTVKLGDKNLTIVGVVKDFNFQSLHNKVEPCFIVLREANTWNIMARLEPNSTNETLKRIEALYNQYNPGYPFEYTFQEDAYAKMYNAENRVATLANFFALLAILISGLGLYGLAAHTTERRFKEMGIRKALGSSEGNILWLLSIEFAQLVVAGIILGLPVSYWMLGSWLNSFAFHIELNTWFFVLATCIALGIAWLSVMSKAWTAARVNPVVCLRLDS